MRNSLNKLQAAGILLTGLLLLPAFTSPLMGRDKKKDKKNNSDTTFVTKDSVANKTAGGKDMSSDTVKADDKSGKGKVDEKKSVTAKATVQKDSIDSVFHKQEVEIKLLKDSVAKWKNKVAFADSCIANLALSRLYYSYEPAEEKGIVGEALQLFNRIRTPEVKKTYQLVPELLKRYQSDMADFRPVYEQYLKYRTLYMTNSGERHEAAVKLVEIIDKLRTLSYYTTYYKNGIWTYPYKDIYISKTLDAAFSNEKVVKSYLEQNDKKEGQQ